MPGIALMPLLLWSALLCSTCGPLRLLQPIHRRKDWACTGQLQFELHAWHDSVLLLSHQCIAV